MEKVFIAAQQKYEEQPVGNFCMVDGVACESWPDLTKEEVILMKQSKPEMSHLYKTVRAAVYKVLETLEFKRAERDENVKVTNESGITLRRQLAFVLKDTFKKHFGVEAEDIPFVKLESFTFVMRGTKATEASTEGVLMELIDVPQTLPYETVDVFFTAKRCRDTTLLAPPMIFRAGQAQQRYHLACRQMFSKQPAACSHLAGASVHYQDVKDAAVQIEQNKLLANAADESQPVMQAEVQNTNASGLNDDDLDGGTAPSARGRGRGTGTGGARRRAASAGSASPATPGATRPRGPGVVRAPATPGARLMAAPGTPCFSSRRPPTLRANDEMLNIALGSSVTSVGVSQPANVRSASGSPPPGSGVRGGVTVVGLGGQGRSEKLEIPEVLLGAQVGRELRGVPPVVSC